jgi:site-specific DNA-adenine methylase
MKTTKYTIGQHLLYAMIYDDESGLEDFESESLAEFCDNLESGGHLSVDSSESYFGRCEITGIMGMVEDIDYVIVRKQ